MTNMLEQQCTIMEHQLERMAVIRKLGKGEEAELALYNTMYDNEEHMSGAQGESERAVDAAAAAGAARVLTALSAKERAQKALPRAPKAARPGTRFPAAPPHKAYYLRAVEDCQSRASGPRLCLELGSWWDDRPYGWASQSCS